MSSTKCQVPGCLNTNFNCDSSIAFHRPPKGLTDEQLDVWRAFCGINVVALPHTTKTSQGSPKKKFKSRICSLHFAESDFTVSTLTGERNTPQLSKNAVPTIRDVHHLLQRSNEEYIVLDNIPENMEVTGLNGPGNDGEEFILSDNLAVDTEDSIPTLIVTDDLNGSQENELLVNESEEYFIMDEPDQSMEVDEKVLSTKGALHRPCPPPLLTFDGQLLKEAKDTPTVEDTTKEKAIVQKVLAREKPASTCSPSDFTKIHFVVQTKGCDHKAQYEEKMNEVKNLEWEIKLLTESNGIKSSSIRRMRSEINRGQRSFGQLFTPNQMNRIRGIKDPWQRKDYQKALFYKYMAPNAYKYLKMKYKFPLPTKTELSIFEVMNKSESLAVFREVSVYKNLKKNKIMLEALGK